MSTVISPTEYVIRTRFETPGEIPGFRGITAQLGGISSQISGLGNALTGALAGAASIQGLRTMIGGVLELHSAFEDTKIGIAGMMNAITGAGMDRSLQTAEATMGRLRKAAAVGAGEFEDYSKGFQMLVGPGMSLAGRSSTDVEEMVKLAIGAGAASGRGPEGMQLALQDVLQGLSGGAGDRTTPILNNLLGVIGSSSKELNAMTEPERWATITRALETMKPAIEAQGKTWNAQMSTFKDSLRNIVMEGTGSLFSTWTEDLQAANKWLEANRGIMEDMAIRLGARLKDAWSGARGNATGLAAGGAGLAAAGVGARAGGLLAGAAGVAGGAGMLLAGGIGAFVGFIGTAVTTAVSTFSWLRQYLAGSFYQLTEAFFGLGARIARFAQSPIMAWIGAGFGATIGFFLNVLTVFVRGINTFIDMFALGADMWLAVVEGLAAVASGDAKGAMAANNRFWNLYDQQAATFTKAFDDMSILDDLTAPPPPILSTGGVDDPGGADGSGLKPPPVINVGKVEIRAERMDDPATVASSFEQLTEYLMKYPRGTGAPLATRAR
ncbi:MAG: hypothetical protein RJA59_1187 [Pseudomonadota bacterium]